MLSTEGITNTVYIGNYYEMSSSEGVTNTVKYYYAGTDRVAMRQNDGIVKWLLGDHLGSTSLVYDGSETIRQGYKAWGERRFILGGEKLPTTFRYTGQREEASIGLYYYGARWYDARLGRFTKPDTIVFEDTQGVQAWDRYVYTNNNPILYNDPSGHCPWCIVGALAGASVGYGIQVYNNYQSGYTGTNAWTQNISAGPIVGGALVGAGAVIFAPAAVAATGDVLVGTGLLTGSTTLFGVGMSTYEASAAIEGAIYGGYQVVVSDPEYRPDRYRGGNPRTPNSHLYTPSNPSQKGQVDIHPDMDGLIGPEEEYGGYSTLTDPKPTWQNTWKYPESAPNPEGIKIYPDKPGHYTWAAEWKMTPKEFQQYSEKTFKDWIPE